jgi:molybdopterin synthase sulfur carrier subunit
MPQLEILYFAWVRDAIGRDSDHIEHPGANVKIVDVVASLAMRGGAYSEALGNVDRLRAALDQQFVPMETQIGSASELALFPPVTGG